MLFLPHAVMERKAIPQKFQENVFLKAQDLVAEYQTNQTLLDVGNSMQERKRGGETEGEREMGIGGETDKAQGEIRILSGQPMALTGIPEKIFTRICPQQGRFMSVLE